jgi:hypothetical protein
MRITVVTICLLLCMGIACARLAEAPDAAASAVETANASNGKCNDPCKDAWGILKGAKYPGSRRRSQDNKGGKGQDNRDNKGQEKKDKNKAMQKVCAGSSCSGCQNYDDISRKQPVSPQT